jgi:hypothetical protein
MGRLMPSKHFWYGFIIALGSGLVTSAAIISTFYITHR